MMNHRPPEDDAQAYRDALVDEIRAQARETAFWTGRDCFDERVLNAIAQVPRHAFIPEPLTLNQAYANHPQPIGFGQTISQPYIVALMTDLLNLHNNERVLEIGAGCGYQSAVLAQLGCEVYAVERLEPLADLARLTLAKLGYERVTVKCADGAKGWAEHAPFDGILVTACQDGPIPKALIEQLNPEGRMVIPLGPKWGPQMLHLGQKDAAGQFTHEPVLPVSFVPLVSRPESG
ncbi:MAG: protein-L-isoaspartate(D-aspartate) O-methyltransferase [Rhodospirillales bacterium]|nr:protein-L-isoaspartate(D-aspartate) O-methyltransferase [Rhodospirillales bacterium]